MHHPDQSTLMTYAAGALGEGASLVVAAHAERCPQCSRSIARFEGLGGALLDGTSPQGTVDPGHGLAECLARIRSMDAPVSMPRTVAAPESVMPSALQPYLERDLDRIAWRRLVAGIWHFPLSLAGEASGWVRLFRFAPGVRVPDHGHRGTELTLVLSGSYRDAFGHFAAGDCADLDDSHAHCPQVDSAEDCIALIASSARTHFHNPLHRLGGRVLGI